MFKGKSITPYATVLICVFFILSSFLFIGCGDDPVSSDDPPVITYDLYVDVNAGNDANNGSSGAPFKTITHALAVAVPHDSIKVAPGTYSVATGNLFPIFIPDSVTLIGNIATYGTKAAGDTVKIEGLGTYNVDHSATIGSGDGAKITGFYIRQPTPGILHFCIVSYGHDFVIEQNTLSSEYGCVRLLGLKDPVVRNNHFGQSQAYGIYSSCTGTALIRDNQFDDGAYISIIYGNPQIINNSFTGSSYAAISIQNGDALIDSNSINGTYGFSALRIQYTSHSRVRNNTITQNEALVPCVEILGNCCPDFGTVADPGGNTFISTSGIAITLESDSVISAIGNTWPSMPPVCGSDIVIPSSGKVGFATSAADTCYGVK